MQRRGGEEAVLMVVDVAFTSLGLNYFTAVVPKFEEFNRKFIESERIRNLEDFTKAGINELRAIWRNGVHGLLRKT